MDINVSSFRNSLISVDHTSEGFLVSLASGDILHIFRLDPGAEGDHIGNNGYIAKRRYSGGVWGATETVYNSNQYDDRNIHGGITNEGRIVVFFRRYDANTNVTEGHYFIYSDNEGVAWTELNPMDVSPKNVVVFGTGQMFYNPEIDKYCIVGYSPDSYCEIRFSEDGSNWDEKVVIAEGTDFNLSEIAGAYCGNGRMIVIERDDNRTLGHPLVQMVSHNNGQTWSHPKQTNIPPNMFWGCAPQLLWDSEYNVLVAMTSDRRSYHGGSFADESLHIFHANPEDIFANSQTWAFASSFVRPKTNSNMDFYGYPTYAKTAANKYFVVFSDRNHDSFGENVDLYQFEIEFTGSPNPPNDPFVPSNGMVKIEAFVKDGNGMQKVSIFIKEGSGLRKQNVFKAE